MRRILRLPDLHADDWRSLADLDAADAERAAAGTAGAPRGVIVPLDAYRGDPARFAAWRGPLGLGLAPTHAVEDLGPLLGRFGLVAVSFPAVGDGRGYSQGRLLRERLNFRGTLLATGAGVTREQLFLLARCGFDAFELPATEDPQQLRAALARYDVAYQPGDAAVALRRLRFGAHAAAGE